MFSENSMSNCWWALDKSGWADRLHFPVSVWIESPIKTSTHSLELHERITINKIAPTVNSRGQRLLFSNLPGPNMRDIPFSFVNGRNSLNEKREIWRFKIHVQHYAPEPRAHIIWHECRPCDAKKSRTIEINTITMYFVEKPKNNPNSFLRSCSQNTVLFWTLIHERARNSLNQTSATGEEWWFHSGVKSCAA